MAEQITLDRKNQLATYRALDLESLIDLYFWVRTYQSENEDQLFVLFPQYKYNFEKYLWDLEEYYFSSIDEYVDTIEGMDRILLFLSFEKEFFYIKSEDLIKKFCASIYHLNHDHIEYILEHVISAKLTKYKEAFIDLFELYFQTYPNLLSPERTKKLKSLSEL